MAVKKTPPKKSVVKKQVVKSVVKKATADKKPVKVKPTITKAVTTKQVKQERLKGANLGGPRENSGKPIGASTKFSLYIREQAAKTGELPNELLLKVSRGGCIKQKHLIVTYYKVGEKRGLEKSRKWVEKDYYPSVDQRIEAAKTLLPYYIPKLAPLQVDPKTGNGAQELHLHFDAQDQDA